MGGGLGGAMNSKLPTRPTTPFLQGKGFTFQIWRIQFPNPNQRLLVSESKLDSLCSKVPWLPELHA